MMDKIKEVYDENTLTLTFFTYDKKRWFETHEKSARLFFRVAMLFPIIALLLGKIHSIIDGVVAIVPIIVTVVLMFLSITDKTVPEENTLILNSNDKTITLQTKDKSVFKFKFIGTKLRSVSNRFILNGAVEILKNESFPIRNRDADVGLDIQFFMKDKQTAKYLLKACTDFIGRNNFNYRKDY